MINWLNEPTTVIKPYTFWTHTIYCINNIEREYGIYIYIYIVHFVRRLIICQMWPIIVDLYGIVLGITVYLHNIFDNAVRLVIIMLCLLFLYEINHHYRAWWLFKTIHPISNGIIIPIKVNWKIYKLCANIMIWYISVCVRTSLNGYFKMVILNESLRVAMGLMTLFSCAPKAQRITSIFSFGDKITMSYT